MTWIRSEICNCHRWCCNSYRYVSENKTKSEKLGTADGSNGDQGSIGEDSFEVEENVEKFPASIIADNGRGQVMLWTEKEVIEDKEYSSKILD